MSSLASISLCWRTSVLALLIIATPLIKSGQDDEKDSHVIEKVKTLMQDYSKEDRPFNHSQDTASSHNSNAVRVGVNLEVNFLSDISVTHMDYQMDVILYAHWRDDRLNMSARDFNFRLHRASRKVARARLKQQEAVLSIGYLKERIWIPDLFYRNSKQVKSFNLIQPNTLIWLYPDGKIVFGQKIRVVLNCPQNLWNFPFDTQYCSAVIGSFGYSQNDLVLRWHGANHVALNSEIVLNEFEFPDMRTWHTTYLCKTLRQNFSQLHLQFELRRKFNFYLVSTYLPSAILVFISYLSFYIDYGSVPARTAFGLIPTLAVLTESSSVQNSFARLSYVRAIDVWVFMSLFFVCVSLVEFAFVNTLARATAKLKRRTKSTQPKFEFQKVRLFSLLRRQSSSNNKAALSAPSPPVSPLMPASESLEFARSQEAPRLAGRTRGIMLLRACSVDYLFRLAFPLAYLLFNICYWTYFYRRP